jgi:hypothetical protein
LNKKFEYISACTARAESIAAFAEFISSCGTFEHPVNITIVVVTMAINIWK